MISKNFPRNLPKLFPKNRWQLLLLSITYGWFRWSYHRQLGTRMHTTSKYANPSSYGLGSGCFLEINKKREGVGALWCWCLLLIPRKFHALRNRYFNNKIKLDSRSRNPMLYWSFLWWVPLWFLPGRKWMFHLIKRLKAILSLKSQCISRLLT